MKEWTKERCSEEPQELQLVADGIYIQRKNIEKVQHEATEGMEAYTDWECDSREITVSEYQMLESIKQINTDKAIDDYTAQLIEEQIAARVEKGTIDEAEYEEITGEKYKAETKAK